MKRLLWVGVAVVALLVLFRVIPWLYVLAPLLGLFIFAVGRASIASFGRGAGYIPDGPPQPVDVRVERTTYWCAGCGAEVLLLVRGTEAAPRHCGERMAERREVARELD